MSGSILFSRHSRRRLRLYGIVEQDVVDVILSYLKDGAEMPGRHEIVSRNYTDKYRYPLKIVFVEEAGSVTVVTAYPVKKERSQ